MTNVDDDGCICQECGKIFKVDLLIPNEIWEKIKPKNKSIGGGLLCGECIMRKIEEISDFGAYELKKI